MTARPGGTETLLRVSGLRTHFSTSEGVVRAVDGVDLAVDRARTLCMVGESGCGKSVTGRSILQLVEPPGRIVEGRIEWRQSHRPDPLESSPNGAAGPAPDLGPWVNLAGMHPHGEEIRKVRGAQIGMVFQEPAASLSPMYTVGDQLVEVITAHLPISRAEAYERGVAQLARVGIPQPGRRMKAYPFQLSGGMCQRVVIAIALSCAPGLLIADEPTTALDVTTQARILDLLGDLQDQTGMAMIFITHDLGVVAEIADDVCVMYLGTVVERGTVTDIFDSPRHPYTQALLRSIPTIDGRSSAGQVRVDGTRRRLPAIHGIVPSPNERPVGCPFHTRCDHAIPGLCDTTEPPLVSFDGGHEARCHLHEAGADLVAPALVLPEVDAPAPAPAARDDLVLTDRAVARSDAADAADVVVAAGPLLDVRNLSMEFPIRHGIFGRTAGTIRAVADVDLTIRAGETLGLVGESGCGKTTLGRCIARALQPTAGQIAYRRQDGQIVDLARLDPRALKPYRREIRVILQDPFSSLNPRMTLLQLIGEPLRANRIADGEELKDRVAAMLSRVGLRPAHMHRYPHAFSGGERQRINIARALITQPRLVIADEAVSALDVSVRAQILNLLADLQDEYELTYLFISHDLSVVEHLCSRVSVMYLGSIIESADTEALYRRPEHPYTEALLHAVPRPDPHVRRQRHEHRLPDDLPDPANPPTGCAFHTRCPYVRADRCTSDHPPLRHTEDGHARACHHAETLVLAGVQGSSLPEAVRGDSA
jgi:peptide/nickel transport system ATP-binding protein